MSDLVLEIAADSQWVPLPLDGDVDEQAAATAVEVLYVRGEDTPSQDRLDDVTAVVAGLARHVRQTGGDDGSSVIAAFALMPDAEPVPVTIAALRLADPVDALDDAVARLVAPPDERYDEPVVDLLETPTGQAARVAQRLVAADESVHAWLGAVWLLPDADATLVLSATFFDLVEAAEFMDGFDDLVRCVSARVEE